MELSIDLHRHYTYADYMTWTDNKMRELLNGFVRLMSPAPTLKHAVVLRRLGTYMVNYIDYNGGDCQVFYAPFDVRFPVSLDKTADNQIHTVVQPDICVVCDASKLDVRGCLGAPDMVVEIISPSSLQYDLKEKFEIYETGGVKEYWVVSPMDKAINVFTLKDNGKYGKGAVYEWDTQAPVQTLKGLNISLETLFKD